MSIKSVVELEIDLEIDGDMLYIEPPIHDIIWA
jgi:hypothetical protein